MKTFTMSTAGLVFTIALIALALFDLGCVLITGTGSTISNFMVNTAGVKSPIVAFTLGWLCSHFLGGQMYEVKQDPGALQKP